MPTTDRDEISTCSVSLRRPGVCCCMDCGQTPTLAVLTDDMVEHTMCESCAGADAVVSTKPLRWDPLWGPS